VATIAAAGVEVAQEVLAETQGAILWRAVAVDGSVETMVCRTASQ
jgi:hypothetical protein